MKKHADEGREVSHGELRVLKGEHSETSETQGQRVLKSYNATVLVGLSTIVYGAAIERTAEDGEITIELPKLQELLASVAVTRCLMPIKLRGAEIKTMRRIMGFTLAELAKRMDDRTAIETVSRWESESQPMGGYAEKVFRLLVCEELSKRAPGIEYNGSMISHLNVIDPWRADPEYNVLPIEFRLVTLKEQCSGSLIEAWNEKKAA